VKPPLVLLTLAGKHLLRNAQVESGTLQMRLSQPDQVFVVDRIEIASDVRAAVSVPREYEALRWGASDGAYEGAWARSTRPELAVLHGQLRRRVGASITFDVFRDLLPSVRDPGAGSGMVIVRHYDLPEDQQLEELPEFTAWQVARDYVVPMELSVEPDQHGPIQLAKNAAWPLERLSQTSVTVVGTGSIGSAAIDALSDLGIGVLNLVDDDRFFWHNIVRHRLGPESVGRFKVNALASRHNERTRHFLAAGKTEVRPFRLDVVHQADVLHQIVRETDVVLCCADGIAPRRVVNHVARIASRPAIFACVLEDGRVGEIYRSRPGRSFGCLACHRAWLTRLGALDPEADQEAPYGTGTTHKPMTAAPLDLALVGSFAAKLTSATLFESRFGDSSQRLPGEHAVIGLRPDENLAWPYSVRYAGEIQWNEVPPPRSDCATCSLAR
jgi:hypothetical protein